MIRRPALALVVGFTAFAACSDPVDLPRPGAAVAASALTQKVPAGTAVPEPPSVRVTTAAGQPVAGVRVDFAVQSGGGTLAGATPVTDAEGVARVETWELGTAFGRNTVVATISGLSHVEVLFEATALPPECADLVTLDLALGQFVRLKGSAATIYPCLLFDAGRSAGSEYVLLLENVSLSGGFSAALFPGAAGDTSLAFSLAVAPLAATAAAPLSHVRVAHAQPAAGAAEAYAWDFGAGRLREHIPQPPPGGSPGAALVRGSHVVDLNSASADPVPGDTIIVRMEGIPRLGINTGDQRAVIRYVSDVLIIAEDVRLATELVREGGRLNTPLTDADMAAIAAEYSTVARVQGDIFFENRHNLVVESSVPHRITAVHSLMPANDIWGYTYSITNYFVWDYWVATDGSTKGLNQHPQRVTDNLFMHEISHMRHMGMLQQNGLGISRRGNRWMVEGFARFSERLPVAARILGTTSPSRIHNTVLPRNPAFNNAYFLDDVPTYLNAGSSIYFGYHTSSYVFDYFADQIARDGGDWLEALREFLVAGGSHAALDDVVQRWLPDTPLTDLVSRARIALYTDDIGTAGLPAWTQYHQFRLRESRPAPDALADQDPRVQWTRLSPSVPGTISGAVAAGAAAGFLVDGTAAASGIIRMSGPPAPNAVVSIARIR
jgi:hypothetical protein